MSAHAVDLPADVLFDVRGLKKHFPIQKGLLRRTVGYVKAVDDVSFFIRRGETLGLVGESGCGKTTASRTALRLYDPTDGRVLFRSRLLGARKSAGDFSLQSGGASSLPATFPGKSPALGGEETVVDLATLNAADLKVIRREIGMVFQDPVNSLNPRMSVGDIVREPLRAHNLDKGRETDEHVESLLAAVGLRGDVMERYPHEFSGGQRQRIGVARALALRPSLIMLDEPVSALDVSIQAQTLNLLRDLQEQFSLTYLFVAHDLSVVQHISDRVAVMYVGKLVESAPADEMYARPLHPYTEALLSAVPRPDPRRKAVRAPLQGGVPDPANPPPGCAFHPRCPYAKDRCRQETPSLREVTSARFVACHFAEELDLKGI